MINLVFKIVHAPEWPASGIYSGSEKDRADGFLHFATAEQLLGTLNRYYADADDLLLVAADATALGDALKYEKSRDGALFPHLYGTLHPKKIVWAKPMPLGPDGLHILPPMVA